MPDARDDSTRQGRRAFLRHPFSSALEQVEERRRTGAYRLSDLKTMPREELGPLKPKVFPACKISVKDGVVQATLTIDLFPLGDDRVELFNYFDGKTSISEISRKLAESKGISREEAFKRVKALFTDLVEKSVCYPAEPPEW